MFTFSTQGQAKTLLLDVPYHPDPGQVYQSVCGERPHTLLLESAEVESKTNLKSLLLIDAALMIKSMGNRVTVQALSDNGAALLPHLLTQAAGLNVHLTANCLTFLIDPVDAALDEESRLKSTSALSILRLIQTSITTDDLVPESLLLAGCFAFDLVAQTEVLPQVSMGANHCPDIQFYLAETSLLLDHQNRSASLIGSVSGGEHVEFRQSDKRRRLNQLKQLLQQPLAPLPVLPPCFDPIKVNFSDEQYCELVQKHKQEIQCGEIFQVVPARRFSLPCPSPLAAYSQLRQQNPSPYMFYLRSDDFTLFGASPESALKYNKQSNQVEIYPIAGTRPRGKKADGTIDYDLDGRIELGLRLDQKELSEHMMLVDLARNDIARISQTGTRKVAELLKVDRYSHVMHLVSRVVGQLKPDLDALHAYQACMNMGTLTGAPKVRAAQLLRESEQERRGSYGGAVGYLNGRGDMDSCIVIRSAFVSDGIAHVQAGAGVVHDSDPQSEANETRAKAAAVLRAIGGQ